MLDKKLQQLIYKMFSKPKAFREKQDCVTVSVFWTQINCLAEISIRRQPVPAEPALNIHNVQDRFQYILTHLLYQI